MMADTGEAIAAIRRQQENLQWISKAMGRLRDKHGGRYIAVLDRTVIDSDEDFEVILDRVRKLDDRESVTIEYITALEYLWLL